MIYVPVVFFVLLGIGLKTEDLSWARVGQFILMAVAALIACIGLDLSPFFFIAAMGILDVILVLMVFKGDLEIR